jgi:hypothetical protein
MSGSLSNHHDEGTRERNDRRDGQLSGACRAAHPQLIGALPAVPPSEERGSAPSRSVTSTEGASAPHARAPALHEALVRAHQDPTFLAHISRLLTKGGETAPHILWGAVRDLLDKGPVGREVIAWDVVLIGAGAYSLPSRERLIWRSPDSPRPCVRASDPSNAHHARG